MKCVARITNNLNLNEKTRLEAMDRMRDVITKNLSSGKQPMSLAAAVIYMSCTKTAENITQSTIAALSGLTEVTIRNRLQELRMYGVS